MRLSRKAIRTTNPQRERNRELGRQVAGRAPATCVRGRPLISSALAAVRWLACLALEESELTIVEVQFAAAALVALPAHEETAMRVLLDLIR